MGRIIVDITGGTAAAIKEIAKLTGRSEPLDVIVDALKCYEWMLEKQANDRRIVVEDPSGRKEVIAATMIPKDKRKEAIRFFEAA